MAYNLQGITYNVRLFFQLFQGYSIILKPIEPCILYMGLLLTTILI